MTVRTHNRPFGLAVEDIPLTPGAARATGVDDLPNLDLDQCLVADRLLSDAILGCSESKAAKSAAMKRGATNVLQRVVSPSPIFAELQHGEKIAVFHATGYLLTLTPSNITA